MPTSIDRKTLLDALLLRLRERLDALTASQKSAQSGATHPDNKQEHAKDMRSTEASYLARGLAERVETLRDGLRAVELLAGRVVDAAPAALAAPGTVIRVEDDEGDETLYLLAPAGGGETLESAGARVLVLTPQSPLGAALAGRREGDGVDVELPSGRRRLEITGIDR